MAGYREEEYTLETALRNINVNFLRMFQEELKVLAENPGRTDIVQKIHSEWNNKYNCNPNGTNIRIEWAVAIYHHGDWKKAMEIAGQKQQANISGFDDLRKRYPAEFRCDNGIYVRSLSELFIADWLYANKIRFEYEREVIFPSCGQKVHCDFYLPDFRVYVEFWGMDKDQQYLTYKNWKEALYHKHGYPLLSLDFRDLKTFRDSFSKKLIQIKGK